MLKKIKTDAGNLSYALLGEGLPVMLVHGFGEDGYVWNDIASTCVGMKDRRICIPRQTVLNQKHRS